MHFSRNNITRIALKPTTRNLLIIISLFVFSPNQTRTDYYKLPAYFENTTLQAVVEIPAGYFKIIGYDKILNLCILALEHGEKREVHFLSYPGN